MKHKLHETKTYTYVNITQYRRVFARFVVAVLLVLLLVVVVVVVVL